MQAETTTLANLIADQPRVAGGSVSAVPPLWFHLILVMFVATMVCVGVMWPERYSALLEEDRFVEWTTVGLFAAAGFAGLRLAILRRLMFAALVALFCFFVAGEEFSWGQRILGFDSPEFFLANNFQQEMTLHNLPQAFVSPKWILILVLGSYGLFLPVAARVQRLRAIMSTVGAAAPPMQLLYWFAAAIVLLVWYPLTLTGEWVEALSGALFLASAMPPVRTLKTSLGVAVLVGVTMTSAVGALESSRDSSRRPCATQQVQALIDDVVIGEAATEALWARESLHKRVWTGTVEGYLRQNDLRAFRAVKCEGAAAAHLDIRHRYAIDPWGSPYWFSVTPIDEQERLIVIYSFGANRRRDDEDAPGAEAASDILASGVLRRQARTAVVTP
jgi:hypothetical protein